MLCNAMGLRKLEEEAWLSWHTRKPRDARPLIIKKFLCTYSEWLLRQRAKKRASWLARHELTHIRRMVGWQSAPHIMRRSSQRLARCEAMNGNAGASAAGPHDDGRPR